MVGTAEPGPEIHEYLIRRLADLGHRPHVRRHRLGREGIMNLAGLGLGVSLVAEHWHGVSYPGIVFRPVGEVDEPQEIIGDLLTAEISEKQTRSIKYHMTIAKLPLARELEEFDFAATDINETLIRDLTTGVRPRHANRWRGGPYSLTTNATLC